MSTKTIAALLTAYRAADAEAKTFDTEHFGEMAPGWHVAAAQANGLLRALLNVALDDAISAAIEHDTSENATTYRDSCWDAATGIERRYAALHVDSRINPGAHIRAALILVADLTGDDGDRALAAEAVATFGADTFGDETCLTGGSPLVFLHTFLRAAHPRSFTDVEA